MKLKLVILSLLLLFCASVIYAQNETTEIEIPIVDSSALPASITNLKAYDTKNDHGHSVTLAWDISSDSGFISGIDWLAVFARGIWAERKMAVSENPFGIVSFPGDNRVF